MATANLIYSNTSPTVEVYTINDSANTKNYVMAQDGYSANNPTALSVQIDYSSLYDRMADALETIASNSTDIKNYFGHVNTTLNFVNTSLSTISSNSTDIKNYFGHVNTTLNFVNTSLSTISSNSSSLSSLSSLSSIATQVGYVTSNVANLALEVDNSGKQLTHIANHFKVERALLVAVDIQEDDRSKVKDEIGSPSSGYGYTNP